MALADPISITIGGSAKNFQRIRSTDGGASTLYRTGDGMYSLVISQREGARIRTEVRIDKNIIAADPYDADVNVPVSSSVYLVINTPSMFMSTEATSQKDNAVGMFSWLTASTNAALIKVIGGEM